MILNSSIVENSVFYFMFIELYFYTLFYTSDAFRKLSKISAKTSILEDPSKLPKEALSFVQHAQYLPPASLTSLSSSTSSTCSSTSSKTTSIALTQSRNVKR